MADEPAAANIMIWLRVRGAPSSLRGAIPIVVKIPAAIIFLGILWLLIVRYTVILWLILFNGRLLRFRNGFIIFQDGLRVRTGLHFLIVIIDA